jgi:hypothetical protein
MKCYLVNYNEKYLTATFYGKGLLAPRPSPKQEDHLLPFVRGAYSIYSQLPSTAGGRPSIRDPTTHLFVKCTIELQAD